MKKKIVIIIIAVILFISGILLHNYLRVKYARIAVILKENLTTPFLSEVKVSDFIGSLNGNIIDDYTIDTTEIGEKEVAFDFINDDNIKVSYTYTINVVDVIEPTIWLGDTYNVEVNSDIDLATKILCGDDYDDTPKCYIEGDYDLNQVGQYDLVYKAEDSSGNKEEKAFTLNVKEPSEKTKKETTYTYYQDVINKYKNENNKIGIDISSFQGDIDFSKLKAAGVEFIIIRVGYGYDNKNFLDKKFKEYIEGANKENIPVGVYYYSYASSLKEAKDQAKWVIKQIKDYKVTLPVVFDWEEWNNYNEYHLSFFGLTSMAEEFLDYVTSKEYKGMLYSSAKYLENIWMKTKYDIWLAQYNENVTYEGDYKIWQLCDDGKVDGIDTAVDIDILFE